MAGEREEHKSAAELLADWRAAGRDAVAARAGAKVAERVLEAATAADAAATAVEVAARAALEAVEAARALAAKAKETAGEAAQLAATILEDASGDKVEANHHVEVTDEAEKDAGTAFHDAQAGGFPKD